jgi:hypothetical protein
VTRWNWTRTLAPAAAGLAFAAMTAGGLHASGDRPPHSGAAPGMIPWKAVAASGRVEAREPGIDPEEWQPVRRGDTVGVRSMVRTAKRSRATLARHGDVILVDPESEVLLPAGEGKPDSRIRHRSGRALYRFEPRTHGGTEVVTPYLVAGVKGTVFSVIVESGFSSVGVVEGQVEVRCIATGETADLYPGDMAVLEDPEGRLELYREGRRESQVASLEEPSRSARRARRETNRLIERAAEDTLLSTSLEREVWARFDRFDWVKRRERRLEQPDTPDDRMEEDKQVLTAEEEARSNARPGKTDLKSGT